MGGEEFVSSGFLASIHSAGCLFFFFKLSEWLEPIKF